MMRYLLRNSITKVALLGASAVAVAVASTSVAAADTPQPWPTFAAGSVQQVYTFDGYGVKGLQLDIADQGGGSDFWTVPLTFEQTVTKNGTLYDEFSFTVPSGVHSGQAYSAIISLPGGGVVFSRFPGYYASMTTGYGADFNGSAAPAGALPEVPYSALMPFALVFAGGVTLYLRKRRSTPSR